MAELTLTKIENGMKDGGTAIGSNFDAVAGAVNVNTNSLKDTGWKSLTLTSASGTLSVRRIGKDVYLAGSVKPGKTTDLSTAYQLTTLTTGFLPDQAGGRATFKTCFSPTGTGTDDLRLQITNGKISIIYAGTNAVKFSYAIDWHWTTNDDFPN